MRLGSIVLAGGRSRRLGEPKEALPFLGGTLLGRAVETLLSCSAPVVVVARDEDQELPPIPLEAEITHDAQTGQGPLVGMLAGMKTLDGRCDAAFVSSCDLPFLTEHAVGWLADQLGDHDMVLARPGGIMQPLAAIYSLRVIAKVEALINEGILKPRALTERVNALVLEDAALATSGAAEQLLHNINSQEDYAAALAEAERRIGES